MKAGRFFTAICAAASIVFLFPIFWMVFAALTPEGTNTSYPVRWFLPPYTLENLVEIFTGSKILLWTWNSMIVAVVSTLLNLSACSMAAFALARIPFHGRRIVEYVILAGLLIPTEALLIALFTLVKNIGLLDSMAGIILPAAAAPLSVIVLQRFFSRLPNELFESAHLDGAHIYQIFFRIALPLTTASIVTVAIFSFLGSWNNFLWPYIAIFSEELFTLPLGVPSFNNAYAQDYILPLTVNLAASLPAIIVFIIGQKQIVQGITMTGLRA